MKVCSCVNTSKMNLIKWVVTVYKTTYVASHPLWFYMCCHLCKPIKLSLKISIRKSQFNSKTVILLTVQLSEFCGNIQNNFDVWEIIVYKAVYVATHQWYRVVFMLKAAENKKNPNWKFCFELI